MSDQKPQTTPFFYKKLQSGFYVGCWLINFQKQGMIMAFRVFNQAIFLRVGNAFELFGKWRFTTKNAIHNEHHTWFLHFMELFVFEIQDDFVREELEKALARFRGMNLGNV